MIYFTSDSHFCHDKPFLYSPRGFTNVADMNKAIIKNWNTVVTDDDEVYHLGDVMLNDNAAGVRFLNRCNGNIRILTGNHDTLTRIQEYVNIRPTILHIGLATIIKYKGYTFYLSHYPTITSNYDVDKPLNKRVISLCGHSHTTNPFEDWNKGLIFHTELDTNNCYPWLLDDIIEKIKEKM